MGTEVVIEPQTENTPDGRDRFEAREDVDDEIVASYAAMIRAREISKK